jgi:hypothetical protein
MSMHSQDAEVGCRNLWPENSPPRWTDAECRGGRVSNVTVAWHRQIVLTTRIDNLPNRRDSVSRYPFRLPASLSAVPTTRDRFAGLLPAFRPIGIPVNRLAQDGQYQDRTTGDRCYDNGSVIARRICSSKPRNPHGNFS